MKRPTRIQINRMTLQVGCCLALVYLTASPVFADGWMFRRSYYSHSAPRATASQLARSQPGYSHFANEPPTGPPSRFAYRRPYISNRPGFSVRGGFRVNRVQINSGLSSDYTVFYEDQVHFGP